MVVAKNKQSELALSKIKDGWTLSLVNKSIRVPFAKEQ